MVKKTTSLVTLGVAVYLMTVNQGCDFNGFGSVKESEMFGLREYISKVERDFCDYQGD